MFGYVRAREDTLSPEDRSAYEGAYCGLCHTLKKQYGTVSRMFLNYDFVFLAMLLSSERESGGTECLKCPMHPKKGKTVCRGGAWMETAAGESVILTWWKLRDTVTDGNFPTRLGARLLCLLLNRAYDKAKARYPAFDARTAEYLEELRGLEEGKSPSIDRTADCFARILQAAAAPEGKADLDRPREQLLYHLGRWIYLIDGVDDLSEDKRAGRYNPLAERFPDWTEADRAYLRRNMDHSLDLMGAAFQLLPRGPWSGALENILYSGLPSVEELVFSGQWREYQKRHRRKNG